VLDRSSLATRPGRFIASSTLPVCAIRLHDLRHTTASLLKRLGVDPNDAMVIPGHSSIAVTLGIYTHGDEDSRRDSLARLDQLLSQARRRAATGQPDTAVAVTFAVTAPDTKNSGGS
jgi:site-specific recombinase XerD